MHVASSLRNRVYFYRSVLPVSEMSCGGRISMSGNKGRLPDCVPTMSGITCGHVEEVQEQDHVLLFTSCYPVTCPTFRERKSFRVVIDCCCLYLVVLEPGITSRGTRLSARSTCSSGWSRQTTTLTWFVLSNPISVKRVSLALSSVKDFHF